MKHFIYCRKSTDREDRQILSTEAQQRLLLEHAERQGVEIVEVYVENQTAYKTGRPLFNAMLARLERGEADGLLTYHLTRLARNSFDGGRLIYMMDEGSVRQILTPEKAYTNNGDDKFLMQIHFAMAKKSSDDTSQFVRRDVQSKLLKGEYPGMVPTGYLNINRDGHISRGRDDPKKYMMLLRLGRPLLREEIDPVEGPLVARLFEEAALGTRSLRALRDISYQLGLRAKNGKKLSKTALWNMLTNPYYYGVIRYNGRIHAEGVQHEPLVTKELFDRVQTAIGNRRKGKYRRHSFSFGGCVVACGGCGSPVTAERQKGHVYYHCTRTRAGCSERRWTREEVLLEQVGEVFSRLRLPGSYLELALANLRTSHATQSSLNSSRRHKLQAQLNACQAKMDALLQMRLSPANAGGALLTDEEYLKEKDLLKEESTLLQKQLSSEQGHSATWIEDCERFFTYTQRLAARFIEAPAEARREALGVVCSKVLLGGQRLRVELHKPFASLAAFPLAGTPDEGQFEPDGWRRVAGNPGIVEKWLGILDEIRTSTPAIPRCAYTPWLTPAELGTSKRSQKKTPKTGGARRDGNHPHHRLRRDAGHSAVQKVVLVARNATDSTSSPPRSVPRPS